MQAHGPSPHGDKDAGPCVGGNRGDMTLFSFPPCTRTGLACQVGMSQSGTVICNASPAVTAGHPHEPV